MSGNDIGLAPATAAKARLSPGQRRLAALMTGALAALGVIDWVLLFRLVIVINLTYGTLFMGLRLIAVLAEMRGRGSGGEEGTPAALPRITLLCPLYREPRSVANLLGSLDQLDYPKDRLEILLLVEQDDDETLGAMPELSAHARVVRIPAGGPRTKPNALNHGLQQATGSIIGVYDAEDRPEPGQLRDVAATFGPGAENLACVQARLNYYNRDDGLIPRLFAMEYALHFDWFLPGLSRLGLPLPLGGTSNFIRRDPLVSVGGWDPYNVTEDADLGLRLAEAGYRLRTIRSTTFEEATDTPGAWIRQRSRWLKGFLQTWLVHQRTRLAPGAALILHGCVGAVVVNALLNPLLWTGFLAWITTGTEVLSPVFEGAFGTICVTAFVLGNAAHLWFMMMAPMDRGWLDLVPAALATPIIWVLQAIAAYLALWSFIVRPHYWSKTEHSHGEDSARERAHA